MPESSAVEHRIRRISEIGTAEFAFPRIAMTARRCDRCAWLKLLRHFHRMGRALRREHARIEHEPCDLHEVEFRLSVPLQEATKQLKTVDEKLYRVAEIFFG